MTDQWTDDELGRLLTDTFAAREPMADPDTAHAVALSVLERAPRRRSWPAYVAAAAAVATIAGVGAYAVTHEDARSPAAGPAISSSTATIPSTPTTTPSPRTYAQNHADAAAESARVVELLPLPRGAERLDGQPAEWSRGFGISLGYPDGSLTRTAWWSVPASADEVEAYLLSHAPQGMHTQDGVGSSSDLDGHYIRNLDYVQDRSPQPDAFVGVSLLAQWMEVGDRTLVRADTFTAAREVRTPESFVDGTVTAVDVERVAGPQGDRQHGGPLPAVHLTEPGDHASITRLVDLANGLRASVQPNFIGSCPAIRPPTPFVTVTFHTDDGDLSLHFERTCWSQVQVRRDGHLIDPTLEPGLDGQSFFDVVNEVADAS